jgi:hypothetical protein
MRNETRRIEAPEDFELGRPRTGPLEYSVTWPGAGRAAGVVFVIPGFGGDGDAEYARSLRRHVAETSGCAAVSVRYHCVGSRLESGASLSLPAREHLMLIGVATVHGCTLTSPGDGLAVAAELAGVPCPPPWGELTPTRGEYQNFGVLQALDHFAVLADLLRRGPAFDPAMVVAFGSSHGGYIAHLMAKLAPRTLAAVLDNSAYVQPPMAFLGVGARPESTVTFPGGLTAMVRVASGWTFDEREAANFYDRDADLVRDTGFLPHLRAMREAGARTRFIMVNAAEDPISPAPAKRRQAAALRHAGFEADLQLVGREDIDGRVFKAFTHGLDASLKGLFDRFWPHVRPASGELEALAGATVDYACVDHGYRIVHGGKGPGVHGERYPLHPELDALEAAEAAAPPAAAAA